MFFIPVLFMFHSIYSNWCFKEKKLVSKRLVSHFSELLEGFHFTEFTWSPEVILADIFPTPTENSKIEPFRSISRTSKETATNWFLVSATMAEFRKILANVSRPSNCSSALSWKMSVLIMYTFLIYLADWSRQAASAAKKCAGRLRRRWWKNTFDGYDGKALKILA